MGCCSSPCSGFWLGSPGKRVACGLKDWACVSLIARSKAFKASAPLFPCLKLTRLLEVCVSSCYLAKLPLSSKHCPVVLASSGSKLQCPALGTGMRQAQQIPHKASLDHQNPVRECAVPGDRKTSRRVRYLASKQNRSARWKEDFLFYLNYKSISVCAVIQLELIKVATGYGQPANITDNIRKQGINCCCLSFLPSKRFHFDQHLTTFLRWGGPAALALKHSYK